MNKEILEIACYYSIIAAVIFLIVKTCNSFFKHIFNAINPFYYYRQHKNISMQQDDFFQDMMDIKQQNKYLEKRTVGIEKRILEIEKRIVEIEKKLKTLK